MAMPSIAQAGILDRDHVQADTHEVRQIVTPLLTELVNHSTNVVVRCAASAGTEPNVNMPPLMLYLHIIELVDGVEVLFSRGCVQPSVPLLRSVFEALLQLEYMFEDDFRRRSIAWLVADTHNRIVLNEFMDESCERGKTFLANVVDDQLFGAVDYSGHGEDARRGIAGLNRFLQREEIVPIEEEYQETRQRLGRKFPPPYALFGGPQNRRELAVLLRRSAQYDTLYKFWSGTVHGGNWRRFVAGADDMGRAEVWPLRNPIEIRDYTLITIGLLLAATRAMVGKYRPEENLQLWYDRDVKPLRDALVNLQITVQVQQEQ
jgi:hypothetical protein